MAFLLGVYFVTDQVDSHTGSSDENWIVSGSGNNALWGSAEDDVIYGSAGDDFIHGGNGADTLHGGWGADVMYGGIGNDDLIGGDNHTGTGTPDGNNFLDGGPGNDGITGGNRHDVILGGAGNDSLNGAPGNDMIFGGPGNDKIQGWRGDDTLTGGPDADQFRYFWARPHGEDRITDFKDGVDMLYIGPLTDAQQEKVLDGIKLSGPAGAYTSATVNLGDAAVDGLSGVIHILFDGTATAFDANDFVGWSS